MSTLFTAVFSAALAFSPAVAADATSEPVQPVFSINISGAAGVGSNDFNLI